MYRDVYCGKLTEARLGQTLQAGGWVRTKRDMGGVIFLDLYDHTGVLQVVINLNNLSAEDFARVEKLHNQSVITVKGVLEKRDAETVNPKIPTGTVELRAREVSVLSQAATLPFAPGEKSVREDLRLQYRYLDLRGEEMQHNLRFRHRVQRAAQNYLDDGGFLSVETPMLTKSTPEGARDYLVPSRVHKGAFYALPQSPQIFKQLLMVGGVDKYYQVARCFRDEDLRADRQPEFTQVDIEMAFVEQEEILCELEAMFKSIFASVMGRDISGPFPRMTWQQAMDTYGSDKPDIRYSLPIVDVTDIVGGSDFAVFAKAARAGGVVRAINVKGGASMTRSDIEYFTEKALGYGAKGMAWIAWREDGELNTILKNKFTQQEMQDVLSRLEAAPGDFVLFCADALGVVRRTLGGLRRDLAQRFGMIGENDYRFLIVTDFPQFEYSEEQGRYLAAHHPFTMPYPEDVDKLLEDPGAVRAQAYDFVLNGVELGSGSIRIHDSGVQRKMFEALGFTAEQIQDRFGFMIEAFRYGTPPHGGFAFGLDRLVMLLLGADSLRDIIAFPKTKEAACPLTNAPSAVDEEQLDTLDIQLKGAARQEAAEAVTAAGRNIDVERVAQLAQLWIPPQEIAPLKKDMDAIIDFADTLSAIDTDGVEITAHAIPMKNVLREDDAIVPGFKDALLAGAPQQQDGYILVPNVME